MSFYDLFSNLSNQYDLLQSSLEEQEPDAVWMFLQLFLKNLLAYFDVSFFMTQNMENYKAADTDCSTLVDLWLETSKAI
ncbi:hypothetical protein NQ318_021136 [Aromia moschata]|uniref:Uncharacterized protein n=1 Tax=Aromia moschata TaxID=1265417 RepID=A0AAV8YGR7_9CUCU|nr:hypothetical protein NQ318_021136 [Aromia moschata]